jgi:hypothetical protein
MHFASCFVWLWNLLHQYRLDLMTCTNSELLSEIMSHIDNWYEGALAQHKASTYTG